MRSTSLGALLSAATFIISCGGETQSAATTAPTPAPRPAATETPSRAEPIRLPYADFATAGDAEGDSYVYSHAISEGCSVVYERWWGAPPRPGGPMEITRVRAARFAGAGGATPISITRAGEQRIFRRTDAHQANLTFGGCTDAEVDSVLWITEVSPMPTLGTDLPDATEVCVGDRDALNRYTATPSHAGAFDPQMPILGEHLNWMTEGAGCVTYPALSGRARCGGELLPWVATTRCQQ